MKLNYKRTIFVGFAFFLISAFWQAYDNAIPLALTNKFGLSQTASGVIMALDNILALFLLPLFGTLSDRCRSRRGRRTPFIVTGTVLAAVLVVALSFVDMAQLKNVSAVAEVDSPVALQTIYDSQSTETLRTPDGDSFVLQELFTREEFTSISSQLEKRDGTLYSVSADAPYTLAFSADHVATVTKQAENKVFTNPQYTDFVIPARQAYAAAQTDANPGILILFIAVLLMVLLSMAIFRSPAVALMPDVTIKPLRSKANAVINLMGTAGGMLVLGLGIVFATGSLHNAMMSYRLFFAVVAGLMLLALAIFLWQVKEPRFVREMEAETKRLGSEEKEEEKSEKQALSRARRRSLVFLLASIVLWFFGYNAITSKYSVYAGNILNKDYNLTLMLAQGAAIVSYLPVGFVASRVGRKKTILAGIVMLTTSFAVASFLRQNSPTWLMNCMFCLAGIGWATINVNSFPMVVEMCKGSDVGKYTGIYYTASMAAQTLTPMLSGFLMDKLGMTILFPYAAIFAGLAFVTMLFVFHGDNKPTAKKGLEALDVED